jgi:hypothetical protein
MYRAKGFEPFPGVKRPTITRRYGPPVPQGENTMLMQATLPAFTDTEDRKVNAAWLRNTFAVYAAVVLFGITLVGFQASDRMTNIAMFMGDAISQAAP